MSKKIILYLIGIVFMPCGVVLTINAHLGAGGYDALNFALAETVGIKTGTAIYLTAAIATLITAAIRKSFPRISTFISAVLLGIFTNIWKIILESIVGENLWMNSLIFFAGMIIISFAVASYMLSGFPTNPTDDLVKSLVEKGWTIRRAKIMFDAICCIGAFVLGGEIGLATIVITFGLGPIINLFYDLLKKGPLVVVEEPTV